jgi:hypothetical protein
MAVSAHFVPLRVSPWKDEWRVEKLKELWNAGHSAGHIGKQLGVPRSAVIGKAYRLKLPRRMTIVSNRRIGVRLSPEMRARISEGMRRYYESVGPIKRKYTKRRAYARGPRVRSEATKPEPLNIPLVETGRRKCKFIQGHDDLCCGHPAAEGKSWCDYHYGVVFYEPRNRAV